MNTKSKHEEMKNEIPTLEEVKEYFKDAKKIKCLDDGIVYEYHTDTHNIKLLYGAYWIGDILLWEENKYAEIISYNRKVEVISSGIIPNDKPERYSSREVNGMDVIDLVKHWELNFNEGNILKYLLRDKGQDISDLEKIIDYAQREIKHKKALLQ